MKKIVYFDEESAIDYIVLKDGGKKVTETITRLTGNIEGEVSAELGDLLNEENQHKIITFIKKAIFNSNLGVGGKIDGDFNKARTTTLNNTVLTDYIKKANKDTKVKKLNNTTIDVYPNSMAYYKLYTPYMELINGAKNYQGVDLTILDKVLNNVKGYTEVITKEKNKMLVIRFNTTTFRGNYRLSDILKMNLDIYAIKVGTVDKYKLDLINEFKMLENEVTVDKILGKNNNAKEEQLEVYDVILAGVANE